MSEDYRMSIFDVVGLGLAYFGGKTGYSAKTACSELNVQSWGNSRTHASSHSELKEELGEKT
jgi:hypothetical protein